MSVSARSEDLRSAGLAWRTIQPCFSRRSAPLLVAPAADDELRSDVGHPGPRVLAHEPQELELRRHDPVPLTQAVVQRVVQARLTADEIREESLEVCDVIQFICHGI